MDLLTLCFFEHPAARVHLKIWEKMMKKRIINKFELKFCEGYIVKRSDEKEIIFCVPIELVKDFGAFQEDLKNVKDSQYLKSLIFGKITQDDLSLISSCIKHAIYYCSKFKRFQK